MSRRVFIPAEELAAEPRSVRSVEELKRLLDEFAAAAPGGLNARVWTGANPRTGLRTIDIVLEEIDEGWRPGGAADRPQNVSGARNGGGPNEKETRAATAAGSRR